MHGGGKLRGRDQGRGARLLAGGGRALIGIRLAGHAKLAARVETRIGGAELAATAAECREWLERGGVDAIQADISRCSRLRAELTGPEPEILNGAIGLPDTPGLGVELDPGAVERYRTA